MITFIVRRVRAKREQKRQHEPPPATEVVTKEDATEAQVQSRTEAVTKEDAAEEQVQSQTEAETKAETRRRRIYRAKLCAGLFLPYLLASLDLTIVATATPLVASYFHRLNQVNWIATAYTLPFTAFIPTYGQLADVFGRHAAIQTALFFILIGSILCAAAQNWPMFLAGRGIQGFGAAGIMNLIRIVLSDKVSLEENSKNSSIFSFVGGISFAIGPVIGGYLSASSWRYCFVLPIPVSVIAMIVLFLLLRKELLPGTVVGKISLASPSSLAAAFVTIDVGGTILFVFGVGLIILGTAWGGATYAWNSTAVLVPLVIGGVLFATFFLYEFLLEPGRIVARTFPRQVAMIPWILFTRHDTLLLAIINFATGAAMYSIFYFLGIYFQVAQGLDSSTAGKYLLFYIPGIGAGVYTSFFLCNKWPRQTWYPLFVGSVLEALGFALLTWAVTTPNISIVQGMQVIAGAGTGLRLMPGILHAVGVWPDRIASALSLMDFAQPFGGTLALTIMGSVFNNKIVDYLGDHPGASTGLGLGSVESLGPKALHVYRGFARKAVMWAFVSVLPIMGICILAALLLGNVWIKGKKRNGETFVVYTSFLVYAFTGRGQTSESA